MVATVQVQITVDIPTTLIGFAPKLAEFWAGMVAKLERNSHKSTPTREDIEAILKLLEGEVQEVRDQLCEDKFDPNSLIELCDVGNFAFLGFLALRLEGVPLTRDT